MTAIKARATTLSMVLALLVTLTGCASFRSAALDALGIGDEEMLEARRLARAERAGRLSDEQIERRLEWLVARLDKRRLHAALWKYGWLTVNAGGGIAAATQAALEDDDTDRVNHISQAGKAAIGVTYLLANPMPGTSGADPVRELPSRTREDKLAQLALAEHILAREAERAHDRTSWLLHVGNFFINAAAAAPVLAYGDESLAARSFGIGFAVGTAQILSQPWKGPSDWEEYEQFVATDGASERTSRMEWQVVPQGMGLGIAGRF